MSILAERKDTASADDLEREAFEEFLEEQDIKSTLPPGADADQALREYIELHGNLRFVLAGSGTSTSETESATADTPAKARPVSELSPLTRKQARKAWPRNLAQALNAAMSLAFLALLVSFTVQFVEVPLNYILGAVFSMPIVLLSVRWLRSAKHRQL